MSPNCVDQIFNLIILVLPSLTCKIPGPPSSVSWTVVALVLLMQRIQMNRDANVCKLSINEVSKTIHQLLTMPFYGSRNIVFHSPNSLLIPYGSGWWNINLPGSYLISSCCWCWDGGDVHNTCTHKGASCLIKNNIMCACSLVHEDGFESGVMH